MVIKYSRINVGRINTNMINTIGWIGALIRFVIVLNAKNNRNISIIIKEIIIDLLGLKNLFSIRLYLFIQIFKFFLKESIK